jgi:hypothetical protein
MVASESCGEVGGLMSLRWVVVWIAATVFAGSAIGEPIDRVVAGGRPSAAEVVEDLWDKSIICLDKIGQSQAFFYRDLVIASSQYGTRVVEKLAVEDDKFIRTVIDADDASLLGRVLTSTITYYDRTQLHLMTSGSSIRDLKTICMIDKRPPPSALRRA